MSNFSDSSYTDGASVEESIQSTLQSGLSALKQKNYQTAIGQLETVYQTATNVPTLLKAQMGLVKAYGATGQPERAVALCRSLRDQPNAQVKAWAMQTLAVLEQRTVEPIQPHADLRGSAPPSQDQASPVPTAKQKETKPEGAKPEPKSADGTGFVPLSANPVTARERISSRKRQSEFDRKLQPDLQDPEQTEILPLDAEVQWQSAIAPSELKPPEPERGEIAPKKPETQKPIPSRSPVPGSSSMVWRQAGRAQKWTHLGKTDVSPLWALQLLTVLLLGWVVYALIQGGTTLLNWVIFFFAWIPFLSSIWIAALPVWAVGMILFALFAASPWLLHGLLQRLYQLQPLSLNQLDRHSPEAVRLLKRVSNQHHRPVPALSVLPLSVPIAFSYGCLPHLAEITVSQGLLQQLSDDEIAAIYAAELGHIDCWDFSVLSGLVLVAQLPYCVYWLIADWGNQQSDRVLQSLAVLISSISYGVYWCCRLSGLWLSQVRLYYSDRISTNLTGNPNGLTRALLKITLGMAEDIQHRGYTHPLLESFDLLMPIGHRAALTLGSLPAPAPAVLNWDRSHRFRHWFAYTTSHPLLGDRLYKLHRYAQRWRLASELEWGPEIGATRQRVAGKNQEALQNPKLRQFLLQISPLVGVLVGLAIGLALWLLGWITYRAHSYSFDWLWYGREAIIKGCMLLGFGIGVLVQINPAFPDIPRSSRQSEPALADLLSAPTTMPIDSIPVRFQGNLLGRRNFYNRSYQDLLLQTSTGLIRLHYTSRGGFLGNLFSQSQRPTDWIKPNETVSVTGWFRRGATPWIDVETIQTRRGITARSGKPVWLTLVAVVSTLWGIFSIFKG